MSNVKYYQQVPIMKRILDHVENSVYILGTAPHQPSSQFTRYNDIMNAMGEGSDLYRSQIDFNGVNFFIDVEYGNKVYPGEIFHKPMETFEKIEGLRRAIKENLDSRGINHLELMTGQGYNYSSKIRRDSASYNALMEVGRSLRVLPWSAAIKLLEKEQEHGNIPLLQDSLVFGALGRITEYLYDEIRKDYSDLPTEVSDIFDNDEIAIFDTSQYGYFVHRRANRVAFSLHQKSSKKPEFGYSGPPISTITPSGLSLEQRVAIRSDTYENYRKAAELAREAKTTIPEVDVSHLLTSYLLSEKYQEHKNYVDKLPEKKLSEQESNLFSSHYPYIDSEGVFWEIPREPNWDNINLAPISEHARKTIDNPNELMLKPWDIRHLVRELKHNNVPLLDLISLISFKYSESHHNWGSDLTKNNPDARAEYWVRTLIE